MDNALRPLLDRLEATRAETDSVAASGFVLLADRVREEIDPLIKSIREKIRWIDPSPVEGSLPSPSLVSDLIGAPDRLVALGNPPLPWFVVDSPAPPELLPGKIFAPREDSPRAVLGTAARHGDTETRRRGDSPVSSGLRAPASAAGEARAIPEPVEVPARRGRSGVFAALGTVLVLLVGGALGMLRSTSEIPVAAVPVRTGTPAFFIAAGAAPEPSGVKGADDGPTIAKVSSRTPNFVAPVRNALSEETPERRTAVRAFVRPRKTAAPDRQFIRKDARGEWTASGDFRIHVEEWERWEVPDLAVWPYEGPCWNGGGCGCVGWISPYRIPMAP